ncbi:MAG: DedA family protein [Phycisphaerae bacterium]
MVEHMKDWVLAAINAGGLPVASLLMAGESMILPLPSEFVMPPLGMLVHQGKFELWAVIVATSIGSLVGSVISYYLGYFGGKPLVMKVGKWLLLNEEHLDLTSKWFGRWGSPTVFICRFVPVVRHFISIPAGIARMNLLKFCIYTVAGATMWNCFLLWIGWKLEEKWETVLKYRTPIDAGMVILCVGAVVGWYWVHLRKPKKASVTAGE